MKSVLRTVGVAAIIFVVGCGDDNGVNSGNGGGGGSFINPRDGQPYRTVVIGGKTWMAENLNNVTTNSWCYNNNSSNCNTYGRLYTWDAARNACPSGWRLPTRQDWTNLVNAAGGWSVAGHALKARSPSWDGDDTYGFSALPGGLRYPAGSFWHLGGWGFWWSATELDADDAYYVNVGGTGRTYVSEGWLYKNSGLSVRCLRD